MYIHENMTFVHKYSVHEKNLKTAITKASSIFLIIIKHILYIFINEIFDAFFFCDDCIIE